MKKLDVIDAEDDKELGLTLIEALISMTIFAIGSLGILALVMGSFSAGTQSQNMTTAYQAAQTTFAYLRSAENNIVDFNGFSYSNTANNYSSIAIVAEDESNIVDSLSNLPGGTESITVSSLLGNGTCPCAATVSVGWGSANDPVYYQAQTIVGY